MSFERDTGLQPVLIASDSWQPRALPDRFRFARVENPCHDAGSSTAETRGAAMGIREQLNRHPGAAALVVVALFAASVAVLALWANARRGVPERVTRVYYSSTDGNTYFADDANRVYPFDHNGTPAYRAYVYRCGDGQPFVSYLARYTDSARSRLTELGDSPKGDAAAEAAQLRGTAIEVRRPGDTEWVGLFSPGGQEIARHPPCPDGSRAVPVEPPQVRETPPAPSGASVSPGTQTSTATTAATTGPVEAAVGGR
jgi:hypothetical protein